MRTILDILNVLLNTKENHLKNNFPILTFKRTLVCFKYLLYFFTPFRAKNRNGVATTS